MIAQLHIRTVCREGITYLGRTYFTPPFKVANITEDKQSQPLHLMLMNSSPGVLDGDDYEIKIELTENSSLHLHTQSYQRLFNMQQGARQNQEVYMEKNTSLVYLPHPAVPHEKSIFKSVNRIYLSDACSLVWGEILTCGRKLNGEIFSFSSYRNSTEVYINNKLIIKEILLMQPAITDPSALGQLEGFTHQASLIILHDPIFVNEQADMVHEYLSGQEKIQFGVSTTAGNGLIVRILGYGAEVLHHHLQMIAALIQQKRIMDPVKPEYAN